MGRSTKSQASVASIGMASIGATQHSSDDLHSNLAAEGDDERQKNTYNIIQYLFICEQHSKMAISPTSRTGGIIWIPYIALNPAQTWEEAAKGGVKYFFGKRLDVDTPKNEPKEENPMPEYKMNIIDVLRVQLPSEKFEVRITHCVRIGKTTGFTCCHNTAKLQWIDMAAVLTDPSSIGIPWGPDIKMFVKQLAKANPRYIFEFSLDDAMAYFNRVNLKNSIYGKLLRDAKIDQETMMAIYQDYLSHCSPAFYMTSVSFERYLGRFTNGRDLSPDIFRAACFNRKGYMDWYEFFVVVICMDPTTGAHEARHRLMFRRFDREDTGTLGKEELIKMAKLVHIDEKQLDALDPWSRFKDGKLRVDDFARWMRDKKPAKFEMMCRTDRPIIASIVAAAKKRACEATRHNASRGGQRRPNRGTCEHCRAQNFSYCLHCVLIDSSGQCTEPVRRPNSAFVHFNPAESVSIERYSAEYRFGDGSVSSIFLDQIRQLKALYAENDDPNTCFEFLINLFENIKDVFGAESRLMKINAPTVVIGDLLGNLDSALTIQKKLCPMAPVLTTTLVFLGNYLGQEGANSLEVLCFLYALKLQAPDKVLLLRGSNENYREASDILKSRCQKLFDFDQGTKLWVIIAETLAMMPFAVVIDEMVFCVHSSVPIANPRMRMLLDIPPNLRYIEDCPAAFELVSKTPAAQQTASKLSFTSVECRTFLQINKLTTVIRGNSNVEDGYEVHFGGQCLTVCSSNPKPVVCYLDPGKKFGCSGAKDVSPSIEFARLIS